MASSQVETQYTKISNELLEAFVRTRFAGQEYQVILAVVRLTCGYHKDVDEISHGQISKITSIPRVKVARLIKSLVSKKILTATQNGDRKPLTIGINEQYAAWTPIPKKGYIPQNGSKPIPQNGSKPIPQNGTHQIKKEKKEIPDNFLAFSKRFLKYQQSQFPKVIKSITERTIIQGASVLQELVRIDGHDFENEICPAIRWAVQDSFWGDKLLSLATLRDRKKSGDLTKFQKILSACPPARPTQNASWEAAY
jgi:phage replication O-like protein O